LKKSFLIVPLALAALWPLACANRPFGTPIRPVLPTATPNLTPDCSSSSAVTTLNNMQMSQYAMYSGLGYGYTAATTSFPYSGSVVPTSGSVAVSGIPASATIVKAFLEVVSVSCQTSVTVNGTAFTGAETGFANTAIVWTNAWYNSTSVVAYGMNYCNIRYDVTSAFTGNGSYNLTFAASPEPLTASIIAVYQVPGATTTTTVSLADGLYFWATGDGNGNYLYTGMNPLKTDLSLCGSCGGSPSNDTFTRIGGGGLWSMADDGMNGAGNDLFLAPASSASDPTTLLSEPATALGSTANDVVGSGPPFANLATYNLTGTSAVPSGATTVSWGLGQALPNWGEITQDGFWVNVLVNSETCP
jgi:hypothetical protein